MVFFSIEYKHRGCRRHLCLKKLDFRFTQIPKKENVVDDIFHAVKTMRPPWLRPWPWPLV